MTAIITSAAHDDRRIVPQWDNNREITMGVLPWHNNNTSQWDVRGSAKCRWENGELDVRRGGSTIRLSLLKFAYGGYVISWLEESWTYREVFSVEIVVGGI